MRRRECDARIGVVRVGIIQCDRVAANDAFHSGQRDRIPCQTGSHQRVDVIRHESNARVGISLHDDQRRLHSHLFGACVDHHQIGVHGAAADLGRDDAVRAQGFFCQARALISIALFLGNRGRRQRQDHAGKPEVAAVAAVKLQDHRMILREPGEGRV